MSMSNEEWLPADLLFEADGHVTEVVLGCLADGELALVPLEASAHVEACDECTRRLGMAALMSLGARDLLLEQVALASASISPAPAPIAARAPAPIVADEPLMMGPRPAIAPASSRRRRPLPVAAIAAALLLAAIATAPGVVDAAGGAPGTIASVLRALPILLRAAVALLRAAPEQFGALLTVISWLSAAAFIAAGLSVARARSRGLSLQGGGV